MSEQVDAAPAVRHRVGPIFGRLYVEIGILVFCTAILSQTGRTDGPVFDVVGPDFLPTVTSYLVAGLTLLQVVVQFVGEARGRGGPAPRPLAARDVGIGVLFSLITCAYVAGLSYAVMPFFLATALFVTASTVMLSHRLHWRDALLGLIVGFGLGLLLQYIFTQVLIIDLPT